MRRAAFSHLVPVAIVTVAACCVDHASNIARAAQRETPNGNGSAAAVEPAPAKVSPSIALRVVFTCFDPGVVVFSDRPCGPAAAMRQVRVQTPVAPVGRASTLAPEPPRNSTRSDASERAIEATARDDTVPQPTACERLEDAVGDIDARMRNGYSAKEAGRLWDRWREAKARLRDAHC